MIRDFDILDFDILDFDILDFDILDFDHKAAPGQWIKNTNEVNGGNT